MATLLSTNSLASYVATLGESTETVVFSNRASSNFLSLVHRAGASTGKGKGSSMSLELQFLDPEGLFTDSLKKVIANPFPPSAGLIAMLLRNKNINLEAAKAAKSGLAHAEKAAVSITKDIAELEDNIKKFEFQTDIYAESLKDVDDNFEKNLSVYSTNKRFLDKILKEHISNEKRSVYIAYGIGDNIKLWSPLMCFDKVLYVEFSFSAQGAKTIKFKYDGYGVHANLSKDNIFLQKMYGKEVSITGYSNKIFNEAHNTNLGEKWGPDYSNKFSTYNPSLHEIIIEVFKDFGNTGLNNGNTVVLFPDLDKLMEPQLETARSEYLSRFESGTAVRPHVAVLEANGFTVTKTNYTDPNFAPLVNARLQELQSTFAINTDDFGHWDFKERMAQTFTYRASLRADSIENNWKKVLTDTLATLSENMNSNHQADEGRTKVEFDYYLDSDFNSLKLLYDSGIIADPSIPALLIGDKDTIAKVIHGNVDEESDGNKAGLQNPMSFFDSKNTFTDEYINKAYANLVGVDSGPLSPSVVPKKVVAGLLGKLTTYAPVFTFGDRDPNILEIDLDIDQHLTTIYEGINFVPSSENLITDVLGPEPKKGDTFLAEIKELVLANARSVPGFVPPSFKTIVKPFYVEPKELNTTTFMVEVLKNGAAAALAYEGTNLDDANAIVDTIQSFVPPTANLIQLGTMAFHGYSPGRWQGGDFLKHVLGTDISAETFYPGDSSNLSVTAAKAEADLFLWNKMVDLFGNNKGKTEVVLGANETAVNKLANASNDLSKLVVKATIKTLPMFHLGSMSRCLNKPCFVQGTEPAFIGTQTGASEHTEKNSWLTGIYNMFAFTNTISANDVTSEFFVQRSGDSARRNA